MPGSVIVGVEELEGNQAKAGGQDGAHQDAGPVAPAVVLGSIQIDGASGGGEVVLLVGGIDRIAVLAGIEAVATSDRGLDVIGADLGGVRARHIDRPGGDIGGGGCIELDIGLGAHALVVAFEDRRTRRLELGIDVVGGGVSLEVRSVELVVGRLGAGIDLGVGGVVIVARQGRGQGAGAGSGGNTTGGRGSPRAARLAGGDVGGHRLGGGGGQIGDLGRRDEGRAVGAPVLAHRLGQDAGELEGRGGTGFGGVRARPHDQAADRSGDILDRLPERGLEDLAERVDVGALGCIRAFEDLGGDPVVGIRGRLATETEADTGHGDVVVEDVDLVGGEGAVEEPAEMGFVGGPGRGLGDGGAIRPLRGGGWQAIGQGLGIDHRGDRVGLAVAGGIGVDDRDEARKVGRLAEPPEVRLVPAITRADRHEHRGVVVGQTKLVEAGPIGFGHGLARHLVTCIHCQPPPRRNATIAHAETTSSHHRLQWSRHNWMRPVLTSSHNHAEPPDCRE